jgi:exopolysaccharide biosynthesis polyprenyl glycosylphosphotransferase
MYSPTTLSPLPRSAFQGRAIAQHPSVEGSASWLKRGFDQTLACLLLALLIPLFLAVSLLIRLDSPGPAFFKQRRVGLNGAEFEMYKFRTMHVDAEARLAELKATNEMAGPLFKMKNDPRITPVGRWLRLTSLDELPQLYNVLRGDMSLVGPRPPLTSEVEHFEPWYFEKFLVRPGITGLWQTSGRSELNSTRAMLELDVQYIKAWSNWLDLKLLVKTAWVVASCNGAC